MKYALTLTKADRVALRAEIRSWEDAPHGGHWPENRPLCAIYYSDGLCTGCPVCEWTELVRCQGTPYYIWHAAIPGSVKKAALARSIVALLRGLLALGDD